ncbi:hypothetical protein [Oceaniglobus trochenteri]|uniref:hypothetical protein n=1 Tax=Oceaniglobus trochenteri TaxID=2763260 RepID=UPI001CFFDD75|nr:hypothetical protein [Oceaniglobus trochenteri]
MRIRCALLLCTALLMPVPASAAPVAGLFLGLQVGFSGVALGVTASTAFTIGYTVGAFFSTTLGSLLLNAGLNLAIAALTRPSAPTIEAARVTSRNVDSPRWQAGGPVMVGGANGPFGEHDADGNFWFITAHADAEMTGEPTYMLDNIAVTLSDGTDGFTAGDVLTDEFCLTEENDPYEGSGTKVPQFRLYTVTPTAAQVYGDLPEDFTDAFPNLPSDFRLAGVAFTIMRCSAVALEHYSKVYRWRGSFSLGEPAVAVYANFNRMYDPRNGDHDIGDPATWTPSDGNPAIVWAWFRTSPFGRNRPMGEVNWARVAQQADLCDQTVLDRTASPIPRYRCGVAFPDNKPRAECEAELLLTCDGFVVYDDEGRAWPRVGVYEVPGLTFSAARDVLSEQVQVVDDGETAVDGVVVNYISPHHGYTKQPCAPWRNTAYYDGTREPNYLTLDILGCQSHNQAVRLAKAIGLRSAATQRVGLGVTIKGILAAGERVINLDLDDEVQGEYEIVTPVEQDPTGMAASFAVVPMQSDRFDLGAGEEGPPPALTPALDIDDTIEIAANVVVTAVPVATSGGAAVRLEATFDDPARVDRIFRFRYRTGTTAHEYFVSDMEEGQARSAVVDDGLVYRVSWQTITAGGRATDWSDERDTPEFVDVIATADPTAPADLLAFAAADGVGESEITFETANDAALVAVSIYRGTTPVFGDASLVTTRIVGANSTQSIVIGGLSAGTHYFWATPINGSGVAGTAAGPDTATIT